MTDYIDRARTALRGLFQGQPADAKPPSTAPGADTDTRTPIGDNLALAGERVTFMDFDRAGVEPATWLRVFETAIERGLPVADDALAAIGRAAGKYPTDVWYSGDEDRLRLLAFLHPRSGLAARLAQMKTCGWLGRLFPEAPADAHALRALGYLEGLLGEATLAGERFGTMLRELEAPQLLTFALLFTPAGPAKPEPSPDASLRAAGAALDRLRLVSDQRQIVELLLRSRTKMSQVAFRRDTSDPDVIAKLAALVTNAALLNTFSAEEHLKMLCLLTVADLGAIGTQALTPWKSELLWRLFVDTYNHLTMGYGDEVIDEHAAARTALHTHRPSDISEAELAQFLEGLPTRYLTLFDAESIYHHVRLGRDIRADDVHFFLNRKADAWELTVVSLDKPFLFSNLCGLLSYLGMDILRGQALTSRSGLVVDAFQFIDRTGYLAHSTLDPLLSDVVSGRTDLGVLLAERQSHTAPRAANGPSPVIYFDNDASRRYTILEIVAGDAPGLLHRVSQVLSQSGCDVDLVLISTEEHTAIDVFHMRKQGAKLSDSEQLALTAELELALGDLSTR